MIRKIFLLLSFIIYTASYSHLLLQALEKLPLCLEPVLINAIKEQQDELNVIRKSIKI